MELKQSPGRIDLSADAGTNVSRLPGFADSTQAPSSAGNDGVRGNFEKTPMNQAFFSKANFQIIQNAIRATVHEKSGEIIDPVGTDDLFMVMRAIYLQYSRNLPCNIPEQIAELNARVSAWSVPKILAELAMYKTYLKDIDTLPVPIAQPTYISEAGTRSKPMPQWF